MMPISPCSAFQHWIAIALQPYFVARFLIATFRAATFSRFSSLHCRMKFSRQYWTTFATSSPSALTFFISSVSSGIGIGESWILNFSSSSPSLHIVLQKSNGRGPICRMRVARNVFTTLQTAMKSRRPRSNSGSVRRQFVI